VTREDEPVGLADVLASLARLESLLAQIAGRRREPALLTRAEAAATLAVSVDHFVRHIQPHLRIVLSGNLRLVPAREIERFVTERARFALER
jgi:hypothetical protein